jgi:hypothetical protein
MLEKVDGKDAMMMRPRMYRHRTSDTSSKGRIVQGRIVQGTHCQRVASIKENLRKQYEKNTIKWLYST